MEVKARRRLMNEPNIESINTPEKRNLMMGCGFLPRVMKPDWWRLCFQCILSFQPYLLKPAIMLAVGFTAPLVAYDLTVQLLKAHTGPYMGLVDIFSTFGLPLLVYIGLTLGSLASVLWGLGASLIALTSLCRTVLQIAPESVPPEKARLKQLVEAHAIQNIDSFRKRKSFLVSVWLMYSVFMFIPTIVLLVSGTLMMIGMPKVGDLSFLPVQLTLPPELLLASAIVVGITTIAISNYTLVLMPYSARSELSGTRVAVKGFLLSWKVFFGITFYSALIFVLSSFLFAPVDLLVLFNLDLGTNVMMRYLLFTSKAIWHVVFFALLVPISVLLPCEMVRGNID
jgi:hypothetical protein